MGVSKSQIFAAIERQAPLWTAEQWDNCGLMVGSMGGQVDRVGICLDLTREVLEAAVSAKVGLVIAHHPLIFKPLNKLCTEFSPAWEASELIRHGIDLYIAHTNLDSSTQLSMNRVIGKRLGLAGVAPLCPPPHQRELKLVTFVPDDVLVKVRSALAEAGAGRIGDYSECAFGVEGKGVFRGDETTRPAVGSSGRLEEVSEIRLEMVCPARKLQDILGALWESHPYEEVAYDLYPTEPYLPEERFIWTGELDPPLTLDQFAVLVERNLASEGVPVRVAGEPGRAVRRVAWCSGGGKSMVRYLNQDLADVFITGDVGHHDALECLQRGVALIDVDHYSTEILFIHVLTDFLTRACEGQTLELVPLHGRPVFSGAGKGCSA